LKFHASPFTHSLPDPSPGSFAFNRAVRARCRLARLAPVIFDSAVVSRREAVREDRRQLMAEWEPAFAKVYGPATDPPLEKLHHAQTDEWCRNGAEMVQFSPLKVQKIESLLAERELWMTIGTAALARHQNLQPHRHVSLGLVARLIDLASKLGRLAAGMELRPCQTSKHPPDDSTSWNLDMAEALHRAYSDPDHTSPSPAPFT
jgi:hypothetical protein